MSRPRVYGRLGCCGCSIPLLLVPDIAVTVLAVML
jgi:hypothetical protein